MRLALILLALTAAPALAEGEGAPPAGTDWGGLLVQTIEDHGCAMTETEAATLLPPLGFQINWTLQVVDQLVMDGRAELTHINGEPTVIVKTEACQ